jgi:hypothetical protein
MPDRIVARARSGRVVRRLTFEGYIAVLVPAFADGAIGAGKYAITRPSQSKPGAVDYPNLSPAVPRAMRSRITTVPGKTGPAGPAGPKGDPGAPGALRDDPWDVRDLRWRPELVAQTADTPAAFQVTNQWVTLSLTSPYTVATSGRYYFVDQLAASTTMPSIGNIGSLAASSSRCIVAE